MPPASCTKKSSKNVRILFLEQKAGHKTELQESLGWSAEPKHPLICLPTGMNSSLGGPVLEKLLPGLLSLPLQILILGKGTQTYGKLFSTLAKERPHQVAIVKDTNEEKARMYASADIALFLSNPTDTKELSYALQCGAVPVAPVCEALENYNPVQEKGTGFLFETTDEWQVFRSLVRSLETYQFPYDWRTIQKQCVRTV